MNLLPCPRSLKRLPGIFVLPRRLKLQIDASLPGDVGDAIAARLQSAASKIGLNLLRGSRPEEAQIVVTQAPRKLRASSSSLRAGQGYELEILPPAITIRFREAAGLHNAVSTMRQLLREYGRRLPCLKIRDWPDFPVRGVMLDVSRGRVPKLETLLELAGHLADFKINQLQLYTEHTFAYSKYRAVWRDWGALTGKEIRKLDVRCRELGIELVPNQNSFGHLREFLAYPPLRHLGEVAEPYEPEGADYLRRPSTLAPENPGTLLFLRELYDELLPNFSSRLFNVGCDETWDLGRGQSRELCRRRGKGRVYFAFLKKIHREVSARRRRMLFWGDIILNHRELINQLPKNAVALNWGYEAGHPFDRESRRFAQSRIPFYVCPGTSTWMTLVGRHDNAVANLRSAADAGRRHGAIGYLITDWGDGGHPQPLAVSYFPYLAGAALGWCAETFNETLLIPVLSRDVFLDATKRVAKAALALGLAHRKLGYTEPNLTPLGAVLAAPQPGSRELCCRHGLHYYARIAPERVKAALGELQKQHLLLRRGKPRDASGHILARELDLAARMAIQSCRFMVWQQAVAAGSTRLASKLATRGVLELRALEAEFNACWPLRNKATSAKCAAFLRWRIQDYQHSGSR